MDLRVFCAGVHSGSTALSTPSGGEFHGWYSIRASSAEKGLRLAVPLLDCERTHLGILHTHRAHRLAGFIWRADGLEYGALSRRCPQI